MESFFIVTRNGKISFFVTIIWFKTGKYSWKHPSIECENYFLSYSDHLYKIFILLCMTVGSGIPELENRVKKRSYGLWRHKNRVKLNCEVIANFSLIFINSEFLMKKKFLSYVTRKFNLYLTLKFPSYATRKFKIHLKFRVTLLKESRESLHKDLHKQLWLTLISGFLFGRSANLKPCI